MFSDCVFENKVRIVVRYVLNSTHLRSVPANVKCCSRDKNESKVQQPIHVRNLNMFQGGGMHLLNTNVLQWINPSLYH